MDVAFKTTADGKLTFRRDSSGDAQLDDQATYAVMATMMAQRARMRGMRRSGRTCTV